MDIEEQVNDTIRRLGWPDLQKHVKNFDSSDVVTWFDCEPINDVRIQVNVAPCHCVCVYAIAAGICSGFHVLYAANESPVPLEDLQKWVAFNWFSNSDSIARYGEIHPECSGYTWEALRKYGEPYVIVTEFDKELGTVVTKQIAQWRKRGEPNAD